MTHTPTEQEEQQADLDEQAYFEREEAELDERQRYWAEEAHKLMHEETE